MDMDSNDTAITPKKYSHFSLRLSPEQKDLVLSTQRGFSAGIKQILAFYKKWRNVDINLRLDLKMSCDEFCELIKKYIQANDAKDTGQAIYYKHLLQLHATYIRRLYHHLDDPDRAFLKTHCFNDRFYGYLNFYGRKILQNHHQESNSFSSSLLNTIETTLQIFSLSKNLRLIYEKSIFFWRT
jgi:hypothetical protein